MSSRPQSPGSGSPRQQQQQQLEQQQQREKNDRDRVRAFLKDWNLLQYYGIFIQEGFDRLEAVSNKYGDITIYRLFYELI